MPVKLLTNASVAGLVPPQTGQSLVWDTKLSGFGVRVTEGGKKVYVAQGRVASRTVRVSIGRADHLSCDQARVLAKARLGELAGGNDLNKAKKLRRASGVTLQAAFDEFCKARSGNKPRTLAEYQRQLGVYLKDWRERPWTAITRPMVVERHRKIGEENGRRTANNVARMLRSLLSFARATYRHPTTGEPLVAENPVRVLSDTKGWFKERSREDHLKPSEIRGWWLAVAEHANETQRDYLYTLLLTGCRANEIAELRAQDVSLKDRVVTLRDTKNGTTLRLPMCGYLHQTMTRRLHGLTPFEYVFPATSKRPSKAGHVNNTNRLLARVAKAASVEMASRHGLRRTFASIGEQIGIGTYSLKRLMNHRSGTSADITAQYAQLSVEALRSPAEKIAEFVLKAAGEMPSAKVAALPTKDAVA